MPRSELCWSRVARHVPLSNRRDHVHAEIDDFPQHDRQAVKRPLGRATLDQNIAPFHVSEISKAVHERSCVVVERVRPDQIGQRQAGMNERHSRKFHRRLRPDKRRRTRARCTRGDEAHELSAFRHEITLSA